MKEFTEEIRKLKAMIIKHEGRIRVLEAALEVNLNNEGERNDKSASPEPKKESLASDEV